MKYKEDFLKLISEKQQKYDFSLVPEGFNYGDKIQIICHEKDSLGREHGAFTTGFNHFVTRGDCCPKCSGRFMDKELFVHESKLIHGDAYDYSKFEFENKNSKSTIICKKHGIEFEQQVKKHLIGHGCPICRYEKSGGKKRKPQEEYIEKARKIHGDKYDYSKVKYVSGQKKIEIICHEKDQNGNEHGSFFMLANNHIAQKAQGCPICGLMKNALNRRYTAKEFEEMASERHENKYKYFQDYKTSRDKIQIECPKHGIFSMVARNHLHGQGCPTCGMVYTLPEKAIVSLLKEILGEEEEIIIHSRDIIAPFELDIYVPRLKIAFEYNGLIWHSEKFSEDYKIKHLRKFNLCKEKGIRLVQIFEDEWLEKRDIVVSRIKSIFGVYDTVIYARKCEIKNVDYDIVTEFLKENHLQGFCPSKIQYGLYYNNELVSLMTFGHTRQMKKYNENYEKTFELLRFAVKKNTKIIGGASKLLKHFIENNDFIEIITYADKRWSNGNMYFTLGFEHTHDSSPNYFYVYDKIRKNRFNFRKNVLVKKGYDETKSEHQIMNELEYYRLYDCGTMVFKMCK